MKHTKYEGLLILLRWRGGKRKETNGSSAHQLYPAVLFLSFYLSFLPSSFHPMGDCFPYCFCTPLICLAFLDRPIFSCFLLGPPRRRLEQAPPQIVASSDFLFLIAYYLLVAVVAICCLLALPPLPANSSRPGSSIITIDIGSRALTTGPFSPSNGMWLSGQHAHTFSYMLFAPLQIVCHVSRILVPNLRRRMTWVLFPSCFFILVIAVFA